jgi:hypothetical protein
MTFTGSVFIYAGNTMLMEIWKLSNKDPWFYSEEIRETQLKLSRLPVDFGDKQWKL